MDQAVPSLESLTGLWRRSLIAWPDGRRDVTTWVNWLQGLSQYADLRQPENRPDFSEVKSLGDIRPAHFDWLAAQEGFAGEFIKQGDVFEWRREIDFQPKSPYSDRGKLWLDGNVMVEQGIDIPYIEHWHAVPLELTPLLGLRLKDEQDGTRATLLRVGTLFMFVRDRQIRLPADRHLSDCLRSAPTLRDAQAMLDLEISQGVVTTRGWIIQRSTLPYRETDNLGLRGDLTRNGRLGTWDRDPQGRMRERLWHVQSMEGSPSAFAMTGPLSARSR
ncbi:MAG: hypothetical protein WBN97_02580 [Parvibaculum sp.]